MEATLENLFIDVLDADVRPNVPLPRRRTVRLTQSRLSIFLKDVDTGRPLVGQPLFVDIECDVRHQTVTQTETEFKELPPSVFSYRIPLGLLATDHLGYASYDLTRLPGLTTLTDVVPQKMTAAEFQEAMAVASQQPTQLAIKAIWIHPYGNFVFNGLEPGLYGFRPDAIVISATLIRQPLLEETVHAGIPSMQEPSIIDWRLSPGSFAITPTLIIGEGDCERFTPANVALDTYYFHRVVLQSPRQIPPPPAPPPPASPVGPLGAAGASPGASPAGPASGVGGGASPALDTALGVTTTTPMSAATTPTLAVSGPEVSALGHSNLLVSQATVYVYRTAWYQLGHSLGKVLYSLAMAPAESSDIAVVDWSRDDLATRAEATTLSETLIADLRRDRTISETIDGALHEKQTGGSTMGAGSLVAGAATAAASSGVGALVGLGLSIGGGSAWTEGDRDLHLSTIQTLADRISQSSASMRELRSTVVVAAHQREQNVLTTRNITNYNHSHTLTILYYELLRHLRVVTAFDRAFDAVLVRFPQLAGFNPAQPESLIPHIAFLRGRLLDPSLEAAFSAYEAFEIETRRPDPAAQRTAQQDTRIYHVTGTLNVWSSKDVDPNQEAIGVAVCRLSPPGEVISVNESSAMSVTTTANKTAVQIENCVWYPAPRFENDTNFSLQRQLSFTLTFSNPVIWDELDGLKVQCVFKDWGNGRAFKVGTAQLVGITDRDPIDLNPGWQMPLDFQSNNADASKVTMAGNDSRQISSINIFSFKRPEKPVDPREPFARLAPEQQNAILRLVNHVSEDLTYYSLLYWLTHDLERIDRLKSLGAAFDASYWPVSTFGSYLVFPRLVSKPATVDEPLIDERLITLPTRGTFADAKLGACNVSEMLDNTRFWDWQKSPIPFRAPEISGVHPESEKLPAAGLQPTAFPTPIVTIQNAPAAPDPSTAAALQALTKPDIFRDMSIAKEVAGVISEVTKAATEVATAAGNMAKAVSGSGTPSKGGGSGGTGGGGGGGDGQGAQGSGSGSGGATTARPPALAPDDAQTLLGLAPALPAGDQSAYKRAVLSQTLSQPNAFQPVSSTSYVPPKYWYTSDLSDGFFTKLTTLAKKYDQKPENLLLVMASESMGIRAGAKLPDPNNPSVIIGGGINGFSIFGFPKDLNKILALDAEGQLDYSDKIWANAQGAGLESQATPGRIYLSNYLPGKLASCKQPTDVIAKKGQAEYDQNKALDRDENGEITLGDLETVASTAPQRANMQNRWKEVVSRLAGTGGIPPDFKDPWCLQCTLQALGTSVSIDGMVGPNTCAAVRSVARTLGVSEPTDDEIKQHSGNWRSFELALPSLFAQQPGGAGSSGGTTI